MKLKYTFTKIVEVDPNSLAYAARPDGMSVAEYETQIFAEGDGDMYTILDMDGDQCTVSIEEVDDEGVPA